MADISELTKLWLDIKPAINKEYKVNENGPNAGTLADSFESRLEAAENRRARIIKTLTPLTKLTEGELEMIAQGEMPTGDECTIQNIGLALERKDTGYKLWRGIFKPLIDELKPLLSTRY